MDFGNRSSNKTNSRDTAWNFWANSRLTVGGARSAPKIGEQWPKEYLPYWRKWMREGKVTADTNFWAWATVHDLPFWKAVVKHIDDDAVLGRGLAWAGMLGNMTAFKAASAQAIDCYAAMVFEPVGSMNRFARRAALQARIVHPDVVVLMRNSGRWDQAQIGQLARAYSVGEPDGAGVLRVDRMSRGLYGFAPSFYLDWYSKALTNLQWNADEQSQFYAHFIAHVDAYASLGQQAGHARLHPDVDTGLIKLSAGSGIAWSLGPQWDKEVTHEHMQELRVLYETVHTIAQSIESGKPWSATADSHPGLAVLMELTPATNGIDLYRLASRCKQIALGHEPTVETAVLPCLD